MESNLFVISMNEKGDFLYKQILSDEENNVTIFDTSSQANLYKLTQNKATLSNILFLNENEIFVTSDAKQINYYKID